MGGHDRLAPTLARPRRRTESVAQPEHYVGIRTQFETLELYARPEQAFAVFGHAREVAPIGVGDAWYLQGTEILDLGRSRLNPRGPDLLHALRRPTSPRRAPGAPSPG